MYCWRFSCFRRGSEKNMSRVEEGPEAALEFAFFEPLSAALEWALRELTWVPRPHPPRHPPPVGHRSLPNFQYPISILPKHFPREDHSRHSDCHSPFVGLELVRFCGVQIDLRLRQLELCIPQTLRPGFLDSWCFREAYHVCASQESWRHESIHRYRFAPSGLPFRGGFGELSG